MPPFDHLHPAVVHFAIAPLSLAPLLVALGLLWRIQRRGMLAAALLVLLIGLASAVLSLLSGEAAERFARATPELRSAVQSHEAVARQATLLFAVLTVGLGAIWLAPRILKKELPQGMERILLVTWLLISAAGVGLVLRTGHEGGKMVHVLGTHAQPPPAAM